MFTINDIFNQIFPWLEGISWDVGTVLTGIVFLGFLVLGFDWVMSMLDYRFQISRSNDWAEKYYLSAENARNVRDSFSKGSIEWENQNMIYKKFLNKSADARVRGWKY